MGVLLNRGAGIKRRRWRGDCDNGALAQRTEVTIGHKHMTIRNGEASEKGQA
jgi:hypothetical protein